jgi:DMSO/TMAO reductase YedYZ molybdopterin-dependent catalytic subunit
LQGTLPRPDTNTHLTPTNQFFQQHWRKPPVQRNPDFWGLLLDGMLETPLALSFDDLQQLTRAETTCTLACTGDLAGTARWHGVPFTALLAEVQPQPRADYAGFYAFDGYRTSLALSQLSDSLLAFGMNGEPLPHTHGGPVRLIVPGLQGYKMPKWLQRIELRQTPLNGPWENRGWSQSGEAPTLARFTNPQHQSHNSRQVHLAGYAFAGRRHLTIVEISANDGPWMPVAFQPPEQPIWAHWSIVWTAPYSGEHRLAVRATDNLQTFGESHTITIHVR